MSRASALIGAPITEKGNPSDLPASIVDEADCAKAAGASGRRIQQSPWLMASSRAAGEPPAINNSRRWREGDINLEPSWPFFDRVVTAGKIDRSVLPPQRVADDEEFRSSRIALVMFQEVAIVALFLRRVAGNYVKTDAPVGQSRERVDLLDENSRRLQAGAAGDNKLDVIISKDARLRNPKLPTAPQDSLPGRARDRRGP